MAESIHHLKKGWKRWYQFKKASNAKALVHFSRAAAHATAAKAWAHFENFDNGWVKTPDPRLAGIKAAQDAVELLDGVPETPDDYRIQWVRAYAYLNEDLQLNPTKFENAEAAYQKAHDLSKRGEQEGGEFDYELLAERAQFYIVTGKPETAVDDLKEAIANDRKLCHFYLDYLGWALLEAGRNKKAARKLSAIDSIQEPYEVFLAVAYANIGGNSEKLAIEVMENVEQKNTGFNLNDHEQWLKKNWNYQNQDQVTQLFKELQRIWPSPVAK
jgi:tetratricopeptide (TPR) repeat protein